MTQYLRFLFFSIVILLASVNVLAGPSESNKRQARQYFDADKTNRVYQDLDEVHRISLLVELLDAPYKNREQFGDFLISAISQLSFRPNKRSTPLYIKLQDDLYNSIYEEAAFACASQIYKRQHTKAQKYLKRILPYSMVVMGYKYSLTNELDSLALINQQMRKIWSNNWPNWIKLEYLSKKGFLASKKGDYYRALIYYNQALGYASQTDKKNISYVYHNLANLYLALENFQRASYYADLSVAQLGIKKYPIEQLNLIGTIQSKAEQYNKASRIFEKVLTYAQANDLKALQAQTLSNYGNLKRRQKTYVQALKMMHASDSICKSMNLDIGIMINAINRAELFFDQKKYDLAEQQLKGVYQLVNSFNEPRQQYSYYKLFAQIKDAQGQRSIANAYFRTAVECKEQFGGDTPLALISHWELKNERQKARHNRTKDRLLALKQQQTKNNIIFSLVVTLLAGAFIFSYFLRKQALKNSKLFIEQQQIHHELELKSKELFAETLKNQSVANVKNEIKQNLELILKNKTIDALEIKEQIKILGKNDSSAILDEFEARFNGVHAHFYQKLKEIAPDLTPHELRLSALIRLNISSKEIAALTNRTVGTVDNTRSIIRRKLGIDESQNLQDFILKL